MVGWGGHAPVAPSSHHRLPNPEMEHVPALPQNKAPCYLCMMALYYLKQREVAQERDVNIISKINKLNSPTVGEAEFFWTVLYRI